MPRPLTPGAHVPLPPPTPWRRFEQGFQALLEQLQPVAMAEQKFCTCFFHFAKADFVSDFDDTDGIQDPEVRGLIR